jgi:hypothetical protein
MIYPEKVEDFARTSVQQYKPDGSDISAGYVRAQPGAEIVATAYSFLMPQVKALDGETPDKTQARTCQALASSVVNSVVKENPGAKTTSADLVTLEQGGLQHGFHAVFAMTVPQFMGRTQEPVGSQAYIFCYAGGKWAVEYRFTYPSATADAGPKIAEFMANLKWTYAPAASDNSGNAQPAANPTNANVPASSSLPVGTVTVPSGVLSKVNQHSHRNQGHDWPITITIVSPPAHGKVTTQNVTAPMANSGGAPQAIPVTQVLYQSAPGYVGMDSFTYKRTSGDASDPGNANTYTMSISVQ